MADWNAHVAPHGPLQQLAPNLWQVTGSLARSPLPRNMHIWRAPSGGLLIHSAVCLDAAGMHELEALGPVQWVVVPCAMHRADAKPYRDRYPDATFLCPAAARKKVEEVVAVDDLCEAVLPQLGIQIHHPMGLKPFELHLLCPLDSGETALIVTDALFNLGANPPTGLKGKMLRWMGSVGPLGMSRIGRWLLLKDKNEWHQYLNQLADTPNLSILCVAHGDAIVTNVAEALRNATLR